MAKLSASAFFPCDLQTVWKTVTDQKTCTWRSDLNRIEVSDDGSRFIEYTTGEVPTVCIVTREEPCACYEFDLDGEIMTGHWSGVFRAAQEGTALDITVEAQAKIPMMNPLLGAVIRQQQAQYLQDLHRALGEPSEEEPEEE